jgi:predicted ester cyclase
MLDPSPPGRRMPMKGFDEEFVDIADYIIRITDRIWHEKKIELCRDYYSDDGVIHTMTGDISGAAIVEANTRATLEAFPDRTLDGDNVIWSGNEDDGYYSSHLITSRMTNLGPSEFGPATGKRARIRTIADCLCLESRIVEEWLMRDNAALVSQLGFDPQSVAKTQASKDKAEGKNLISALAEWRGETAGRAGLISGAQLPEHPETNPEQFANYVINTLWNQNDLDALSMVFDFRAGAHLTNGRDLYGTLEYREYCEAVHGALGEMSASVDHVACIPYLGDAVDIAVRWTIAAKHCGDGLFGAASGAPVFILASSHWRVINGRIREEWTVFDELALLRQIAAHRLDG